MSNTYKFFHDAYSSMGHISYIEDYIHSAKKIIIMKNLTKRASELIFGEIGNVLDKNNAGYKALLGCGKINHCDALKTDNVFFVNGKCIKEKIKGDIVDFSDCYGDFLSVGDEEKIIKKEKEEKENIFYHLSLAKKIHDDWEKIYIENMDFDILGRKTDALISNIFRGKPTKSGTGKNERGFFGSMLPEGNVNYIDDLTKGMKKRILINGRPGTGKSTILKKIRKEALDRGFSVASYYCSFDPVSLDMIIIREMGLSVFDATYPHEKKPQRAEDEVFDVYEMAVKKDTDEKYQKELSEIKRSYNEEVLKAKMHLKKVLYLENEKEKVLSKSLNYGRLQKTLRELEENYIMIM